MRGFVSRLCGYARQRVDRNARQREIARRAHRLATVATSIPLLLLASAPVFAAESIALKAGPLTMLFEPDNALLRHIRIGEQPVLQGISAPVRNQYWGTVSPKVTIVKHEQTEDSCNLIFDVSCQEGDIDFDWRGVITGNADGRVVFTFDGEARSTFLRNRIGFCVLHGPEAAGRSCVVETIDGKKTAGRFPKRISPHQPFKNIRAISHQLDGDVWAHVRMEGDTFETEDQRNWTDASFKTYCTPLEIPYPVRVEQGTKISHRIEVTIDGAERLPVLKQGAESAVLLEVTPKVRDLPKIGLRLSSQVDMLSPRELQRLKALQLGHLRVDVTPADSAGTALRRAGDQAKSLSVPLQVAVHLGEDPERELRRLIREFNSVRPTPTVSHWLVIGGTPEQLQLAKQHLGPIAGKGLIGIGQDSNFTELNRERPDATAIGAVSYGLNPQVHAFDNTSMVETLAIQPETVLSAREFLGEVPLLITPITLRPHRESQDPGPGELPSHVDARQPTMFAACWTLGSIKYLAEASVDSLTYFETVGWLGVMETEQGSPLPARFPSRAGAVFPIYHVLQDVGAFAGGTVRGVESSDPMSVVGLALERGGSRRLLMANLSGEPQRVRVDGSRGFTHQYRLGAPGYGEGTTDLQVDSGAIALDLAAHEIVRLDAVR
jgi:hypothetical protein